MLDDDNGTVLAAQLLTLADEDPDADVALWINSPGGSVPSMLAIRDVMRLIPCDVATLAFGIACSAGQFLLSSGTKGKRYALPHSRILMHQGSAGIAGSAVEVELQAADLRLTRDTVLGLIAEDTGQPMERIFEDSRHDHWYTAPEARDYGFVDAIAGTFAQVMPARKRPFGLRPTASSARPQYRRQEHRRCRVSSYTIPNVVADHPRGERIMDVYSHLLTERIVVLGTPIDPGVANTLTAQLIFLEAQSPDQEINLYINCEGGDIPSMLAIYDTMRFIKAPVATTCVGQAVAAGAVLLAAGAQGRRLMLPHARVILHQPGVSGQGTIPDLILQADELVRLRGEMESVLSEHTGQSVETLRADTDRDRIFTAQAAVDYGLVDEILTGR